VDEEQDLGAWLYRTTSNVCYDILRRTKQALAIDGIAERDREDQVNRYMSEAELALCAGGDLENSAVSAHLQECGDCRKL